RSPECSCRPVYRSSGDQALSERIGSTACKWRSGHPFLAGELTHAHQSLSGPPGGAVERNGMNTMAEPLAEAISQQDVLDTMDLVHSEIEATVRGVKPQQVIELAAQLRAA